MATPRFDFAGQVAQVRALLPLQFEQALQKQGAYKLRSHDTHTKQHGPALQRPSTKPINILLLGDSMLERIKTTGAHTVLGRSSFPDVFNAGVGGDKVRNIIYRLGTLELYKEVQRHGIQQVVLQMGTNDLKKNGGWNQAVYGDYLLVLEALLRMSSSPKVLVTGLMPRKDIQQKFIDEANTGLEKLVVEFNKTAQEPRAFYMPPPPQVSTFYLVDHVHLKGPGYTIFVAEIMRRLHLIESPPS